MYGCACWFILLLPLVAPQAPGDVTETCPMSGTATTRVLLDSNQYDFLPWVSLNMEADDIQVGLWSQLHLFYDMMYICLVAYCGEYSMYAK